MAQFCRTKFRYWSNTEQVAEQPATSAQGYGVLGKVGLLIPKPGQGRASDVIEYEIVQSAALEHPPQEPLSPPSPIVAGNEPAADATQLPSGRTARESAPEHSGQLWTSEVDRLFTAALNELRTEAEKASTAAEQRRIAEITELSQAIRKQHSIIEGLRRELTQQRSESERINALRSAWQKEKDELTLEARRQRTVAEQLADQLAALKANDEAKERQYLERLKEITAEVDRCLLRARAEWVSEVARMSDATDWQLPSFLTKPGRSGEGA